MNLLYALESVRTPFWDAVFSAVTHLGEETVFMVAAILIFWCVSKQEGYYLLLMGFFGTVVNQFLKLLFRIPRPWVRDPDFTIVESARAQATGYSFPSGHTQNAVATFGGIARSTRRPWVSGRELRAFQSRKNSSFRSRISWGLGSCRQAEYSIPSSQSRE